MGASECSASASGCALDRGLAIRYEMEVITLTIPMKIRLAYSLLLFVDRRREKLKIKIFYNKILRLTNMSRLNFSQREVLRGVGNISRYNSDSSSRQNTQNTLSTLTVVLPTKCFTLLSICYRVHVLQVHVGGNGCNKLHFTGNTNSYGVMRFKMFVYLDEETEM